jgi:hypothetical protein
MANARFYLLCSGLVGLSVGWCHLVSDWHFVWILSLAELGIQIKERNK